MFLILLLLVLEIFKISNPLFFTLWYTNDEKIFWIFYLLSLHAIRKKKRLQDQWSDSHRCLMIISRGMVLQSLCPDFFEPEGSPTTPEKISNFWYFQIECRSRDRYITRMLIQLACFSRRYFLRYSSLKFFSKSSHRTNKDHNFFVLLSFINLVPFNRDRVGMGPK